MREVAQRENKKQKSSDRRQQETKHRKERNDIGL
jgi:hypothetical protein